MDKKQMKKEKEGKHSFRRKIVSVWGILGMVSGGAIFSEVYPGLKKQF
jgi:hypothetical protein